MQLTRSLRRVCVRVPGRLVGAGTVDMGPVTDCFMSLAAVAAVACGVTRIVGIANQRVKECNRLAVMVSELSKCGVRVKEVEDGLEIAGLPDEFVPPPEDSFMSGAAVAEGAITKGTALHGAIMDCHNDHRIAMSLAVLACSPLVDEPVLVLDDASCTAKTYVHAWRPALSSRHDVLTIHCRPYVVERVAGTPRSGTTCLARALHS